VHHLHLGMSHGWHPNSMYSCVLYGELCPDSSALGMHHGDTSCTHAEHGTECFTIDAESLGHTWQIREPMSLRALFNDVRPAVSPSITWYCQIGLLMNTSASGLAALSSHFMINPGEVSNRQLSRVVKPLYLEPNKETFFFYTGHMPFSGRAIRHLFHSHMSALQIAQLYAGLPCHMGLCASAFQPFHADTAYNTASLPWGNNRALRAYISETAIVNRVQLICDMVPKAELVGTFLADRRADINCSPWRFQTSDSFTMLSFNNASTNGEHFPMHTQIFLYYAADDRLSHYTAAIYSPVPNSLDVQLTVADILNMRVSGYTPTQTRSMVTVFHLRMAQIMIWLSMHLKFTLAIVLTIGIGIGTWAGFSKVSQWTIQSFLMLLTIANLVAWISFYLFVPPTSTFMCNRFDSDLLQKANPRSAEGPYLLTVFYLPLTFTWLMCLARQFLQVPRYELM